MKYKDIIDTAIEGRLVRNDPHEVWQRLLDDGTWTVEDERTEDGFTISRSEMGLDTWEVKPKYTHIWMDGNGSIVTKYHRRPASSKEGDFKKYNLVLADD